MVDLYLSLGIMISLCGLAAYAGASLRKRAGHATVFSVEILVCLATAAYLRWLWDRPVLSQLLPFSGTIILGNWLPITGLFFLGVCLKTERITLIRRVVLTLAMVGICGYSLAKPMMGEAPDCLPGSQHRTLSFQTTKQTCSAACAVSLLRLHGVSATEDELAKMCLTRQGTHWLGVYRGLKLKTANTAWDVVAEEVDVKELFTHRKGFGVLALSFQLPDQVSDPESGFESDVGHSVLLLKSRNSSSLDVFDPSPEYGFETWTENTLANVERSVLLRLVPRDGGEVVINIDSASLRQIGNAFPPIARR